MAWTVSTIFSPTPIQNFFPPRTSPPRLTSGMFFPPYLQVQAALPHHVLFHLLLLLRLFHAPGPVLTDFGLLFFIFFAPRTLGCCPYGSCCLAASGLGPVQLLPFPLRSLECGLTFFGFPFFTRFGYHNCFQKDPTSPNPPLFFTTNPSPFSDGLKLFVCFEMMPYSLPFLDLFPDVSPLSFIFTLNRPPGSVQGP